MSISETIIGKVTNEGSILNGIEIRKLYAEGLDNVLHTAIGRPTMQIVTDVSQINELYFNIHGELVFYSDAFNDSQKYVYELLVFKKQYGNEYEQIRVRFDGELGSNFIDESLVDGIGYIKTFKFVNIKLENIEVNSDIKFIVNIVESKTDKIISSKEWISSIRNVDDVHDSSAVTDNTKSEKFSYLTYRDKYGNINDKLSKELFEYSSMLVGVQIYPDKKYKLVLYVGEYSMEFNLYVSKDSIEKKNDESGFLHSGFTYLLPTGLLEINNQLPLGVFDEFVEKVTLTDEVQSRLMIKVMLKDDLDNILASEQSEIFYKGM